MGAIARLLPTRQRTGRRWAPGGLVRMLPLPPAVTLVVFLALRSGSSG
ncbi:MAG TPA: hypothetical protein VGC06_14045 [Actinomycetes bacterium]